MTWLAVLAGGALGSLARHGVNVGLAAVLARPVPYATGLVNIVGAAIIGILAGAAAGGGLQWSPTLRAFVFVGVLGGFTTFSSFMLDTLTLRYTGEPVMAFLNVAGQLVFGLAAVWAGYSLGLSIR